MDNHFNIRGILQDLGYTEIKEFPNEFRLLPIYRESKNKSALCVKKDTGRWVDYVLGVSGSFPELVKITLNLQSIDEAQQWLKGKNVNIHISTSKPQPKAQSPKTFNKDLLLKLRKDYSYWENRGIDGKVLSRFQGGMVYAGKMAGRFVFPIFNSKQQIVGFTGRDTYNNNSERPKWKHIGTTADWVYPAQLNIDSLKKGRAVILVESIGDCLALFNAGIEHVLVVFGLNLSRAVVNFLIKIDVKCVTIALNNDGAMTGPGNQAAMKMRMRLGNYFDLNQIEIALPDKKDFGEMTQEEIQIWNTKRPCQPQV